MRAIWSGAISFGLVSIPISLYPATRREDLRFRLLRKGDLSPVNYKRVAASSGTHPKDTESFRTFPNSMESCGTGGEGFWMF